MHFTPTVALLSALSTLTTAAAVPNLAPRTKGLGCFKVSEFAFSHTPHSSDAAASFNVTDSLHDFPETNCEKYVVSPTSNGLASINTTTCADNSTKFSILDAEDGFHLTIIHQTEEEIYNGTYFIPASAEAYFESPPHSGFKWQYLNTSATFDVPFDATR